MLVLALAGNPPKAHASVEIFLKLDGVSDASSSTAKNVIPVGTVPYVVSLVSSLVLP
jgi:hypothetical protein